MFQAIQDAGVIDDPDAILKAAATTKIETPLAKGAPPVVLGGEAEYGRPRELRTPVVINRFHDGQYRTVAVLDYAQ
jgi:hypothetical protein